MLRDERATMLQRTDIRRLLSWTVQGHEKIIPLPTREGDRFPEVSRIIGDPEKVVLMLEELTYYGIYRRVKAYSELVCPSCKSAEVSDKYACPFCNGQDLEKGVQIQHFSCGHVDLEARFQKDGNFACPRCGKEPRLIGTDYQRIENVFHCNHCGREFSIPKIAQTCSDCNASFAHEEADLKPVFGYTFNEEKRDEILADSLMVFPQEQLEIDQKGLSDLVIQLQIEYVHSRIREILGHSAM